MKRWLSTRLELVVGLLLALLAFGVYCITLSRTIGWEDSGEIATSIYTLGILHPTGYPTFTMLGWAFSHLPLGGTVIWRLNLLVAILTSASVFFFFKLFSFLLSEKAKRLFVPVRLKVGQKESTSSYPSLNIWAAGLAALTLAFSRTFWSEGVSLEVYAFHLLLISIVTNLFLKALLSEADQTPARARDWALFAFTLGLSFTNHMMTVLFAPAYIVLFFQVNGLTRHAWKKILQAIPFFALGLLPYLYLYLRSAQSPLMNWGEPSTLGNLWSHVTGLQYHAQMFASTDVPLRKIGEFFGDFPGQFAYAPLILIPAGIFFLWIQNRRLLTFALLIFIGCLFYSINYDFEDPNFYLNAYVATAILISWGIKGLLEASARRRFFVPTLVVILCIALFPLVLNYRDMDLSQDRTADEFARNMLASVEPNGILFSQEEQVFLFPALYLQVVENVRPDVVVLNGLWLSMPWYHHFIEVWAPDALNGARAAARPMFATQATKLQPGIKKVPEGLAWRLYRNVDSIPTPKPPLDIQFNPIEGRSRYKDWVRLEYGRAFHNQGWYRGVILGDTALGIFYLRKALTLMPGYGPSLQGMQLLGSKWK